MRGFLAASHVGSAKGPQLRQYRKQQGQIKKTKKCFAVVAAKSSGFIWMHTECNLSKWGGHLFLFIRLNCAQVRTKTKPVLDLFTSPLYVRVEPSRKETCEKNKKKTLPLSPVGGVVFQHHRVPRKFRLWRFIHDEAGTLQTGFVCTYFDSSAIGLQFPPEILRCK